MTQVKTLIKDNYNLMLLNDFLRKEIKEAGFSKVEVAKTPTGTRITLYVTKPGIVIGRKGAGIKELTSRLETDFQLKNPQIAVEEIKKPELSPNVMCNRMAAHIQRGTAFRRVTMWTLNKLWKVELWVYKLQFQVNYVVIDLHLKSMKKEFYQELVIMQR